jgi:hypothetical protein
VTEEVERSAEEEDADVVEMIEDAHEVMSGGSVCYDFVGFGY